ncbi:hypothetical protein DPEC_G00363370 [Dallia pectoralis]|nr:hypothetical protein DPEC_G00363370 [Dallia pectoralis]
MEARTDRPWDQKLCSEEVHSLNRLCNDKSPCPLPVLWTNWASWAKCSSECGGGVHSRVRTCENGNTCPGCALEYKACNLEACPEVRRNTPWTPWMPVNVTQDGARQEQRTRYTCRALLSDPHQLQLGKRKVETRVCPNDGSSTCETDRESVTYTLPLLRGQFLAHLGILCYVGPVVFTVNYWGDPYYAPLGGAAWSVVPDNRQLGMG